MATQLARMQLKNEALSPKAYRDELTKPGNRASCLSAENELELKIAMREPLAFGLAESSPGTDQTVSEVFDRADRAMYALKKQMKRSQA